MDIKDKKPCRPGQVRNPETGRCKKVVESTKNAKAIKDKKPCKPGQVRNPETGRCKKVVEPTKKPCKPDQVRNPETGRCKLKNNVIDPNKFFGKNAVQERNKTKAIKDKKPCKSGQVHNPETGRCKKVVEPTKLKNNVIDPNKFFGKNAVQERNKARQSEQKVKKKAPEQAPKKKSSK